MAEKNNWYPWRFGTDAKIFGQFYRADVENSYLQNFFDISPRQTPNSL